ncbi:hypothetical protein Ancab_031493 [Ancistrocladus abbreviatus]
MPLNRYQLRNEYSLADPDLYRVADKDDPEALLEGVAMAGLVGVLRQLGDLAEFAAGIFHDLNEEVMAMAARGHGLIGRVQQLEAEFPAIEKILLSQTSHTTFLYNSGVDWHPNLRMDQNLIAGGDLPRFVMDSYEECRGPPRLFLLDKFDVAGAGACLKRYTDPSFFKVEATSTITKPDGQREKRTRKVQRRGPRWINGGTPESFRSSHAKLHQLLLEERIENEDTATEHRVKLKKRELAGSPFNEEVGRSYMDKFLETCLPEQKVREISANAFPMHVASNDTGESGFEIVDISTVSPAGKSPHTQRISPSSPKVEDMVVKPSVDELNEIIDKETTCTSEPNYQGDADKNLSTFSKVANSEDLDSYMESKSEGSVDEYDSDKVASEVDNYLDALATMESENETDPECRTSKDLQYISKLVVDSDASEGQDELHGELLDSESVRNANTSNSGNCSFKNSEGLSCSETVSSFAESTADGDGATIVVLSPLASVTEPADVLSDQQSVSEELPGNEAPDQAVCTRTHAAAVEILKDKPKFGEGSWSSCLTDLNTTLQSSNTVANPGQNSILQAEVDEVSSNSNEVCPMSVNTNQRWEHQTANMSSKETLSDALSETKDSLPVPAARHPVDEMACEDSDISLKAIQDLPIISDASEDNCSARSLNVVTETEPSNDDSLLNLVDGMIDSPRSTSSAGDEWTCESGLPEAEDCSDVASLQKNSPICNLCPDIGKPAKLAPDEDHCVPSTKENSENFLLPIDPAECGNQLQQHVSEETDVSLSPQPDATIYGEDQSIRGVSSTAENEEVAESVLHVDQSETPPPVSASLLADMQGEPAGKLTIHSSENSVTYSKGIATAEVMCESSMSELDPSQTESTSDILPSEMTDTALIPVQHSSELVKADTNDPCTREDFNSVSLNEDDPNLSAEPIERDTVDLDSVSVCLDQSDSTLVCKTDTYLDNNLAEAAQIVANGASCDDDNSGVKCQAISYDTFSVNLRSEEVAFSDFVYLDSLEQAPVHVDAVSASANITDTECTYGGDDFALSSKLDCSTPGYPHKLQEESFSVKDSLQNEQESKELPLRHDSELYAPVDVNNAVVAPANSECNSSTMVCKYYDFKLVTDGPDCSLAECNNASLEFIEEEAAILSSQKGIQDLESNSSRQMHLQEHVIHVLSHNLTESEVHLENGMELETSDLSSSPSQDSQHIDKTIWVGVSASDSYSIPPLSQPSVSELLQPSAEHDSDNSVQAMVQSASTFPQIDVLIGDMLASPKLDGICQLMDPSCSRSPFIPILPNEAEINLNEIPPLPPLPPMQWRLGRLQHSFLPTETQMTRHTCDPIQVRAPLAVDDNNEIVSQTPKAEKAAYVNPFLSLSPVGDAKWQDKSGCSTDFVAAGASTVSMPPMGNENCQQNALSLDSRQVDTLFSLPEECARPQTGVQSSEVEPYQPNLNLAESEPTIQSTVSEHINGSTGGKKMELETADFDEQHPQIPSVAVQEFLKPPVQFVPLQTLHNEQQLPQGFMAPGEVPAWLSNTSNIMPSSEDGNVNGTLQKKLPRPRNPLIDAVIALDKSKLRKVERVKSQVVEQTEERDTLLQQIRNKSFNLKPAVKTRPRIQGPKTNLKVAAILEKASTIRQAMAGSDEDESDSWSDS